MLPLQDFFDDMRKLVRKKDKAAIKREYKIMYDKMLDCPKPETHTKKGGKLKSTQESGTHCFNLAFPFTQKFWIWSFHLVASDVQLLKLENLIVW